MPRRPSPGLDLFEDHAHATASQAAQPERSIPADVTPEVLRWARESAGLDIATIVRRFRKIQLWETGSDRPTVSQLEALSDLYKRPLVTFFLPSPPTEPPLPRDFRVLPSQEARTLSKKVLVAIRTARRVQRLYAHLARDLQETRRPRLPVLTIGDDPEHQAVEVRRLLEVTDDAQRSWRHDYAAWGQWRGRVEGLGMLVLQLTMPTTEVRGFSLSNGPVPTIAVSSSDAVVARIFTLFHELGHVLLAAGGVCLPDPAGASGDDEIEPFCNQFSGALLLPMEMLRSEASLQGLDRLASDADVELRIVQAAKAYKVSRWVILLRLLSARSISRSRVQRLMDRWRRATPPETRGGPVAPAAHALNQYGAPFVSMVLEAHARNLLTTSDVASYQSLKVKHLSQLQRLLAGQRG